ncbi:hypothetical protein FT663_05394 [Candidozyma haemuli var. vulneris]|uniref:Vacuolar protein sorting-associated protein 33A n=1 Tax=Candidozyma haemuli TaxID=45357 RepID=A0A2V1AQX8_9ASCO|nr:hypothetical protein CXQ85_002427 [[Candida] haemuloni]KAF3985064.1 hypothetical protein FT662_05377 [[Candida] haemuloni var. vulneris]KAF3985187.1 hypothetical protein FT663_05394 [[Candida] haemuloni var. vulneris]PVH20627.1 hypothetical protein CXQ85_002427 [[Candida] haemuloni]
MTNQSLELGPSFNKKTTENLFNVLRKINTSDNLFVLTQKLSQCLNYLTSVSELKAKGKFDRIVWLETLASSEDVSQYLAGYGGLIVVLEDTNECLSLFRQIWPHLSRQKVKVSLIVKDLGRAFYYEISKILGSPPDDLFKNATNVNLEQSAIRINSYVRLLNWHTFPLCIEDFVLSLNMEAGGLQSYFENPIPQLSLLSDALVQIVDSTKASDTMKFKNLFAKGDHSAALSNILMNDKLTEYLASGFSPNERDFYTTKLRGNTDLVVLERNLDYFPLLLDHMNYSGLLDDLFGTSDELNNVLKTGDKLNDELFDNIKDLNFASIGMKLNKLARYIQSELGNKDNITELQEIKQLVKNLGNLTAKQELVRKHTALSEAILEKIKNNREGDYKHDIREWWLELQNEIFNLDYKRQIAKFHELLNQGCTSSVALSCAALVSLINDGIKPKDFTTIEEQIHSYFGLQTVLAFRKMRDLKLLKAVNKSTDFFSGFTFGKSEIETTTTTTLSDSGGKDDKTGSTDKTYEDVNSLGITGGQDVYKSTYTLISKFWNLHPLEEEGDEPIIETISDYPNPSFVFPSATVPLTARLIESLYFRDFLKYKPVNNVHRRPNWEKLNLDAMFRGQTIDDNICDESDNRKIEASKNSKPEYVIAVFIGGITRGEVTVLRYLQTKLARQNKTLFVLTSGIVSNHKLMEVATE